MAWTATATAIDTAPSCPTAGSNVQIGTGTSNWGVRVAHDLASGRLFAVLRSESGGLEVFRSEDAGASWTLAAVVSAGAGPFDLVVVGGHGYLCYGVGGDLRMRRFGVADGTLDGTYGEHLIHHEDSLSVVEVATVGNAADDADVVGCAVMYDNGWVELYYANASSGAPFTDAEPGISDAYSGVAVTWRLGATTGSEQIVYLAYVTTGQEVRVHRADLSGWDGGRVVATDVTTGAAIDERTSIAAAGDTVLVAFESDSAEQGHDISYLVSYDRGESWPPTPSRAFDGDATTSYYTAQACACSGSGIALATGRSSGEGHAIEFRERHGYAATSWLDAVGLNDHDFWFSPEFHDFEWLGHGWGVAYIDTEFRAWFGFTPAIRYCGFECGTLGEWSSTVGGP